VAPQWPRLQVCGESNSELPFGGELSENDLVGGWGPSLGELPVTFGAKPPDSLPGYGEYSAVGAALDTQPDSLPGDGKDSAFEAAPGAQPPDSLPNAGIRGSPDSLSSDGSALGKDSAVEVAPDAQPPGSLHDAGGRGSALEPKPLPDAPVVGSGAQLEEIEPQPAEPAPVASGSGDHPSADTELAEPPPVAQLILMDLFR